MLVIIASCGSSFAAWSPRVPEAADDILLLLVVPSLDHVREDGPIKLTSGEHRN